MTNLKAWFWAAVAGVAVTATAVTVGAYTGEFGFSESGQLQAAAVAPVEGASQRDSVVPAAAHDAEYVERETEDGPDGDDGYENEYEGDDDSGERDDQGG